MTVPAKMTRQGVVDLNHSFPSKRPPPVPKAPTGPCIEDVIYSDHHGIRAEILGCYPEARLTKTPEGLAVSVPTTSFGWYKFLLTSRLHSLSLIFQLALKKDRKTVEDALDIAEPGWRHRLSSAPPG